MKKFKVTFTYTLSPVTVEVEAENDDQAEEMVRDEAWLLAEKQNAFDNASEDIDVWDVEDA